MIRRITATVVATVATAATSGTSGTAIMGIAITAEATTPAITAHIAPGAVLMQDIVTRSDILVLKVIVRNIKPGDTNTTDVPLTDRTVQVALCSAETTGIMADARQVHQTMPASIAVIVDPLIVRLA
ncbi:hypothetical protein ACMHYO_00875 [Allopusillimonas ginsengisoli]|uniref:hypothetical protein n=1 Tax=Allopusillimonas ginsengisoli TaxID=453575 RepID=UPI0010C190F9|nr:hypothetical protein D7I39_09205 [Allopusillimonas ginsengisoli]